ncbi:MAG TPA: glycosyltransferase [Thermoanaerobaculia bacterium]|nr:glycosyltransferase [Thermoanaerobaculia bacterium]
MTVSVLVPAYNYAAFLRDALDSVLAQTFDDWECVIVDDGSTDDTATVAREYAQRDSRFRVVHQENRGLAAARNTAIANSRGELVQFLDADDRLAPRKLERHVEFLRAHPETDIVYSEVAFFRTEEPQRLMASLQGKLSRSLMARVHGNDEARAKLQHYNIMPVLAAMVRRSVFDVAGTFDEGVPAHEDYGFWIRCAAAGCRFDYCGPDDPVAAVRTHGTSMSRDSERMIDGLIAIARRFESSPLRERWSPLIYEVALGIDDVEHGERRKGARRIANASRAATESLTALRWRVYAIAARLLPRSWFLRIVRQPIPESLLEWYRRLRR